jgi:histidinol-phosphate aminotransferase
VMRGLGERGVIVRSGTDLGGPGHLRVTFGTREENNRFLEALDQTLAA